ncbi:MAG: hypothetical protein PHE49_06690 [bacterium]|nr:hypothetical protein [bacterium]
MKKRSFLIIFLISLYAGYVLALGVNFKGQASGWVTFADNREFGIRYMPELRISQSFGTSKIIDAEVSLNIYSHTTFESPLEFLDNGECRLYRSSLRYSMEQSEFRVGLQKINFGPAKILRSLTWFDRLDARDPLELTDGVYAALARYYFLNNANIWLWGLWENDKTKGLEIVKTAKQTPELGGRWQSPLFKGEGAFSFNHRSVDTTDWRIKLGTPIEDGIENRFAIDGDWDIGPGIWFENSVSETKINSASSLWQKFLTIGTDYTFGIGPGIHILCEHFIGTSGTKINESLNRKDLSAVEIDFNLGFLDRINAIGYYDWMNKKLYSYLGLQRTYDNWKINILAFSNKKDSTQSLSGNGVQFIITYNH